MPLKIAGKQIEDSTITQSNMNISTISITDNNNATNKSYTDSTIASNLGEMYYSQLNLNMAATGATVGQKACLTAVIEFPLSEVLVRVNGTLMDVGSGKDCYFSPDGSTIRTGALAQKGDYLYWNSSRFNLDSNDSIDFIYFVGYQYVTASGGTVSLNPKYNTIVTKFTGVSGDTMIVIISGVSITVGNVAGQFVWDITNVLGAGSHTFTIIGESITVTVNGSPFVVWYDGLGSLIYSIMKSNIVIYDYYMDFSNGSNWSGGLPIGWTIDPTANVGSTYTIDTNGILFHPA